MEDNVEQFPVPVGEAPEFTIQLLRAQLLEALAIVTSKLAEIDSKLEPTTYQTLRWLGAAFKSCEEKLGLLAKTADLPKIEVAFEGMVYLQIPILLLDAEKRVINAMKPFKLDDLPPGKPGEKEFERLLAIEIKINRAYSAALRELAQLTEALASDTYKLDLDEEARAKSWRAARRTKLTQILVDTDKQIAESKDYLFKLEETRAAIVKGLEETDQMTFDAVDASKVPEIGSE